MTLVRRKLGIFSVIGPGFLQKAGTSPSGEATLTHLNGGRTRSSDNKIVMDQPRFGPDEGALGTVALISPTGPLAPQTMSRTDVKMNYPPRSSPARRVLDEGYLRIYVHDTLHHHRLDSS